MPDRFPPAEYGEPCGLATTDTAEQACRQADVIVIGSGLPALAFVNQLLKRRPDAQVAILERGPAGRAQGEPATPHQHAAGTFRVLEAPSVFGGGSSAWRGFSPTPRAGELADWPGAVRAGLDAPLAMAHALLEVAHPPWNEACAFSTDSLALLREAAAMRAGSAVDHAPLSLACDGQATSAREFWQRCASLRRGARPVLACFDTEVLSLRRSGDTVDQMDILQHGRRRSLRLSAGQQLVLAAGCLASTRLAWPLIERPGLVASLNGHIVSELTFQLDVLASDRADDAVRAFNAILQSGDGERAFHLQLIAAHAGHAVTSPLSELPPFVRSDSAFADIASGQRIFSVTAIAEARGAGPDECGHPRFAVRTGRDGIPVLEAAFRPSVRDEAHWHAMDDMLDEVLRRLGRFGTPRCMITQDGRRHPLAGATDLTAADSRRYPTDALPGRRFPGLMHASGMLAMGEAESAATDPDGRVRGLANLHAVGMGTFTTPGSHNGALTAVALALRSADALADR